MQNLREWGDRPPPAPLGPTVRFVPTYMRHTVNRLKHPPSQSALTILVYQVDLGSGTFF